MCTDFLIWQIPQAFESDSGYILKPPENWWLSGSEIPLAAIP